jgi:hypothetical protein
MMPFLRSLTALVITLACSPILCAQTVPGSDRIRVQVTVQTETERKNLKGTHADRITEHKTLAIRLTGKVQNPETRVIRWTVYGKDLQTNKITTLGTEDVLLALGQDGTQAIAGKRVSTTFTPDHILSHGKNREGGKVAAEGVKYLGYAVHVRHGEKIVGEASDPPGVDKRK